MSKRQGLATTFTVEEVKLLYSLFRMITRGSYNVSVIAQNRSVYTVARKFKKLSEKAHRLKEKE